MPPHSQDVHAQNSPRLSAGKQRVRLEFPPERAVPWARPGIVGNCAYLSGTRVVLTIHGDKGIPTGLFSHLAILGRQCSHNSTPQDVVNTLERYILMQGLPMQSPKIPHL